MVCVVDYRFSQTRKVGRKFLFNDVLDTFYLRLYCVGHMVKDHAERERKLHGLCYTSCGKMAGKRNSLMRLT